MDEAIERIVIQVVMLNKLRPQFQAWLHSIGMDLAPMPDPADMTTPKPDDLPTYIVIPDAHQMSLLIEARDELSRLIEPRDEPEQN